MIKIISIVLNRATIWTEGDDVVVDQKTFIFELEYTIVIIVDF